MNSKLIACMLTLALAAGTFACGSGGNTTDTTRPDGESTTAPPVVNLKSGVPEGTTFDGATVRIMNAQYFDRYLNLVNASESTGDTVNDAVYERNLRVMDKLDVNFEYTNIVMGYSTTPESVAKLRNTVMAGEQEWDLIHDIEYYITKMVQGDLLYNLADAPYIDIEQPWWSTDYIKKANFNDKHRYFLTGDFSIGHINQLSAVYYNKNLYEDYFGDPEAVYDMVLDGKWTMDKMYELSSQVWKDVNGNSKVDFDDVVGYARPIYNYTNLHTFFAAGGSIISYDSKGVPYLDGMKEINVGIAEKLYHLLYENPGICTEFPQAAESDFIMEKKFNEGSAVFITNLMCGADHLRDMKDDYGIIPYPKYDETVDHYSALVHNQSASIGIPAVTSTSEMACAVMEELAFEGHLTMVPEYYSVALKQKYVRDSDNEKAAQIIDLIHDSATTDFAFLQAGNLGSIGNSIQYCIEKGNSNYASEYDSRLLNAKTKLADMLEKYSD